MLNANKQVVCYESIGRAEALGYNRSNALITKRVFSYLPNAIECSAGFQPCRSRLRGSLFIPAKPVNGPPSGAVHYVLTTQIE